MVSAAMTCAWLTGMRHAELGVDEDEDDEDFVGGDKSSSSGGSDDESGDESGDAEMIEEEAHGGSCIYLRVPWRLMMSSLRASTRANMPPEEEEKPKKAKKAAVPKKEPKSKEVGMVRSCPGNEQLKRMPRSTLLWNACKGMLMPKSARYGRQ
eukprot:1161036-Pelagomonas_calceolata.AAC.3